MRLARALRLYIAAQGHRSTREARKVSFLATPNMSTVDATHIYKVDYAMQLVQIDEAASCGRCYTRRCV